MYRDMSLIRRLLIALAENETVRFDDVDFKVLMLHLELMIEGGLIEGFTERNSDDLFPSHFGFTRITWKGFDFLDAAKDPSLWERAKNLIGRTGGSATLQVWQSVLSKLLEQSLGELS